MAKEQWADPEFRSRNTERMRTRNPSRNPETVAKIQATKKAAGVSYEHLTGGNGRLSPAEAHFLGVLGVGWVPSYAVTTHKSTDEGYPHHYKIDLAYPELQLGVECDGNSHKSSKARVRDRKKTDLLNSLGWTILRFWNHEIFSDTDRCAGLVSETMQRRYTT